MNTTEAAALLNVEIQTVSRWCQRGIIVATKPCGRWVITSAAVEVRRREMVQTTCLSCGKVYESNQSWPLCHDCQVKRNNQSFKNERRRTVTR
jgi:predicted site-specific integrase-resolvase